MYELTLGFRFDEPDLVGNPYEIQQMLIQQIMTMDHYTNINIFSTTVFPILVFSSGLFFYQEKVGVFPYLFFRGSSQAREIGKAMLLHAFFSALGFYLAYIIFMTAGYFCIGPVMGDVPRNILDGIFGTGFYSRNVYLYYLLEGFYMYFLFPFAYTLFVCSVALLVKKQYLCMAVPICYYFGLNIIIGNSPIFGTKFMIFQPAYTLGFPGFVYDNPSIFTALKPLIPLLPIAIFACIGSVYYIKRSERIEF